MLKSRLSATCAAAVLSLAFVAPAADAGQAPTPKTTTLTGCVVRDAANGGKATVKSNGISYKLTAKNDQDFAQYLGKKVEVTGALMTGQTDQRATSGSTDQLGVPRDQGIPKDQTAVGGQKDVPVTGAARDNTVVADTEVHGESNVAKDQVPLATDKGTTADLTGRIDVKTIKTVAGSCL